MNIAFANVELLKESKINKIFRPNIGVYEESNPFSSTGMKTPNLDHLASKSLVLTNAYTQVT